MMKSKTANLNLVLVILLVVLSHGIKAQRVYQLSSPYSFEVNEIIVLRLTKYVGEQVQWQHSSDGEAWVNIPGEVADTIGLVASESAFYRAKVIAGDCDPFFSDVISISVYELEPMVVKAEEYGMTIIEGNNDTGQYVYDGDITPWIEPGSVLLGTLEPQYMRTVIGWELQNGQTIVQTRQAKLREVFKTLDLNHQFGLFFGEPNEAFLSGILIFDQPPLYIKPGIKTRENNAFDISGNIFEIESDNGHMTTVAIHDGYILFEPIIQNQIQIDDVLPGISAYGLQVNDNIMYGIQASVVATAPTQEIEDRQTIFESGWIPFKVGPLFLYVQLTFDLVFMGAFSDADSFQYGFEGFYTTNFGSMYTYGEYPPWTETWQVEGSFEAGSMVPGTANTDNHVAIFVESRLRSFITGQEQSQLIVAPYLSVNADAQVFDVRAGILGELWINNELLDEETATHHHILPPHEWPVYSLPEVVTDVEGNVYPTVSIGNREWLAKNLRTRHYNNGDPILKGPVLTMAQDAIVHILDHNNIEGLHSDSDVLNAYGALYNSFVLRDSRGVCPPGWDVATIEDWIYMRDFVMTEFGLTNESNDLEGLANALKSCRQVNSPLGGDCATSIHPRWNAHNYHFGNDLLGFRILPAGEANFMGVSGPFGASFSALSGLNSPAARRSISAYLESGSLTFSTYHPLQFGYSIRCVRPTEPPVNKYRLDYQISPPEAAGKDLHSYHSLHEPVDVTLDPYRGYNFLYWKLGNSIISYEPDFVFTMPGNDVTLTAHFEGDGIGWGPHCEGMPQITDTRDNTVYKTLQMGDQCWLKENMRYLPSVNPWLMGSVWPPTPGYPADQPYHIVWMYQGNDVTVAKESEYYQAYGVLYNWMAAQDACPAGWRLPSHDEWTQMEQWVCQQLGNNNCEEAFPLNNTTQGALGSNEGMALKSCRNASSQVGIDCRTDELPYWWWPYGNVGNATDDFGFSAHAGGLFWNGDLVSLNGPGVVGSWWTGTVYSTDDNDMPTAIWFRQMDSNNAAIIRSRNNTGNGRSVRCIRDE